MEEKAVVQLENVQIYQDHHLVLKDLSLRIDTGEFIYLIGKTGSGKSSFLKTLYGELPLKEGKGTVADFNLTSLKRKQIPLLRRQLGIVFQDFQLLTDRSVHDNLIFVMKATGWKDNVKMEEKIKELLESVGLSTKGYKMPYELSGGEQQRVAIARALVNDPPLILADEPTGNLDPETSREIMALLHKLIEDGKSVIMATHDYSMIDEFRGRMMKCEKGSITDEKKLTPA